MSDLREQLERAVEDHSTVRIVYSGGSQPGATREITPIAITGDRVRARCHVTGRAKVFLIARMRLADGESSDFVSEQERPPDFESVAAVHVFARDTLEGMGFDVVFSEEDGAEILRVHRVRKNGNPLKAPEVELQFDPILRDFVMDVDDDGELIERELARPAERPFLIRAKAGYTARFVSLDRAAKKFLGLVDEAKR